VTKDSIYTLCTIFSAFLHDKLKRIIAADVTQYHQVLSHVATIFGHRGQGRMQGWNVVGGHILGGQLTFLFVKFE